MSNLNRRSGEPLAMPFPEESTKMKNPKRISDKPKPIAKPLPHDIWNIRSLRVDGLPPKVDSIYLFSCFSDNVKVLAATVLCHWRTGVPLDYGFVEFASHSAADFVFDSYHGELMPNFSHERFCLSWDTDGLGTWWRWDRTHQRCSFFGYDEIGNPVDLREAIASSEVGSAACPDKGYTEPVVCYHIDTESDAMSDGSDGSFPLVFTETDSDEDAKSDGSIPVVSSCSLVFTETVSDEDATSYGSIPVVSTKRDSDAIANSLSSLCVIDKDTDKDNLVPLNTYQHCEQHQPDPFEDSSSVSSVETDMGMSLKAVKMLFTQSNMSRQQHAARRTKHVVYPDLIEGIGGCLIGRLTLEPHRHFRKGDMKMDSSLEKEMERELYLCFEEVNIHRRSCYVFRTIKLSELLACSCRLSMKSCKITKCKHCKSKTNQESQLRQRAWRFTSEEGPASKEERIPKRMGGLASGSQMFFAGGMVPPPDAVTPICTVPSGDVYWFDREYTVWQKLDWSFLKAKIDPLLFEVKGDLYCLAITPIPRLELDPSFEVYNSRSGECLALPVPVVNFSCQDLACAVVGTKILVSRIPVSPAAPCIPIMCFDVNEKEKKWREMPSLFDGKPFPFGGRALVLDSNGAQVMFSFREYSIIYVSRLAVNDDGDIRVSHDRSMGVFVNDLMKNVSPLSYSFVDLGDEKVAFVYCGNVSAWGKINGFFLGKVRVVVVVMKYEVAGSEYVESQILSTRTFEYNCHHPYVSYTDLIGGFVV